jgi:hypothetical protein
VSRIPEAVARVVASALDGEFHDDAGLFFDATPSGNIVQLTVQDAETDEKARYTVMIEVAK